MNIEGVEVGHGQPCRTVAELGNAHNGDLGRALRLIDAAKAAGADFAKFQAYTPDELVALRGDGPAPEPWGGQGWTMRTLYHKAATPLHWFPTLFAHARKIGIVPFSSVFGLESLMTLEKVKCPAYKIAALDEKAVNLRKLLQARGHRIIASTHRSGGPGVPWADLLLHCPPGYPQDPNDIDWQSIRYGGYSGLSYHGIDRSVPIRAATEGAYLVECHFQLDGEPSELEANVSLTASQFEQMVRSIRRAEALL